MGWPSGLASVFIVIAIGLVAGNWDLLLLMVTFCNFISHGSWLCGFRQLSIMQCIYIYA